VNDKGIQFIPFEDHLLKLRILIAAHCGPGGLWQDLQKDVDSFVHSCIHCLSSVPGKIVPRPLGHALHAVLPNKLLHFDFCYMGDGEEEFKYTLILKDDHSGYVRLVPTISWFTDYGIVEQWVSDRGTHFKNTLMKNLREALHSSHHFTLAYCPWSNGSVEVVCRELLRATRAILSEMQLDRKAWPSLMPIVQSQPTAR